MNRIGNNVLKHTQIGYDIMSKAFFYIKAHWLGECPYVLSILVNFIFAIVWVRLVTYWAFLNITWDESLFSKLFLSYLLCFSIFVSIWGTIGAFRYLMKNGSSARILLSYLYFSFFTIHNVRFFYSVINYSILQN